MEVVPHQYRGRIGSGLKLLREAQREMFPVTIRDVIEAVAQAVAQAAILLDCPDHPLADSLAAITVHDARTLYVFHEHLAGYYNYRILEGHCRQRDGWIAGYVSSWQLWVYNQSRAWPQQRADLTRAIAMILVQQNTKQGVMAEIELLALARAHYPVFPGGFD
ncbi:MAG: hypothetical protein ACK5MY_00690 [Jhaorihella sp.]